MAAKSAIEIVISAVDKASATFWKTASSFEKLSEKMQIRSNQNEYSLNRMNSIWKEVFSKMTQYVSDFTDKASNTKEAGDAMDRLAKNLNLNSKDILSGLQNASKWTVANYDLILAANKAMSLGVAKNTNDFTTLMEIARTKAKNMGITTTQAYNDIVTGLGRWSAMILDNLGIVVNSTEANEEYAKSIGKTVSQLTDAEKKQALINKVVADGRKEMQAMGDIELTTAEKKAKLTAQIENMKDRIGSALIPIVQKLMDYITPIIEKITRRVEENPRLAEWIIMVVGAISWLLVGISTLGLAVGPIWTVINVLGKGFWALGSILPAISWWFSSLWPIFSALTWPIGIIIWVLTALGVAYATNLGGFRDFINQLWGDLQPILQEIWTAFVEVFGQIWETIQEVRLKLEPILIPLREWFWEVMSEILPIVWNLVTSTFKAIGIVILSCVDTLGWIIDFVKNVFTGNRSGARENIKNIFKIRYDAIIGIFSAFNIDLPWIIEAIKTTITNLWDGMFNGLKNIASWAIGWISDKISAIWDKIQSAKDAIASLWWWWGEQAPVVRRSVGGRASWGTVLAGQLYRINELGTEYFRPAVNGTISRSPSPSSPQITLQFGDVHIGSESDMNTFTEKVRAVLIENYRNLALWTY